MWLARIIQSMESYIDTLGETRVKQTYHVSTNEHNYGAVLPKDTLPDDTGWIDCTTETGNDIETILFSIFNPQIFHTNSQLLLTGGSEYNILERARTVNDMGI